MSDFLDNVDIPAFGIEIDPKDLTDILEDVGDEPSWTIGSQGDPLIEAVNKSA